MRDSDTGWDWPIAVGVSIALCVATIGAGLLGEALCRLFLY